MGETHFSDQTLTVQIAGATVEIQATVSFSAHGSRFSRDGSEVEVSAIATQIGGKMVALPSPLVDALAPDMADTLAEIAADQRCDASWAAQSLAAE